MRSTSVGVLQVVLLAAAIANEASARSYWGRTTTPRPDPCPESDLQEARTLLRNAVARMSATLPESIPAPDVAFGSYTLYNGSLSIPNLMPVNVSAVDAVCGADERHFPFVIGVGVDATMTGNYDYYFSGDNVTTTEHRGRMEVTYKAVSFKGKLIQHLGHTSGSSSDGTTSISPLPVWNTRVTLNPHPVFGGLRTKPVGPQVRGVPYWDMIESTNDGIAPIFYKLPQTHLLPALEEALGHD